MAARKSSVSRGSAYGFNPGHESLALNKLIWDKRFHVKRVDLEMIVGYQDDYTGLRGFQEWIVANILSWLYQPKSHPVIKVEKVSNVPSLNVIYDVRFVVSEAGTADHYKLLVIEVHRGSSYLLTIAKENAGMDGAGPNNSSRYLGHNSALWSKVGRMIQR